MSNITPVDYTSRDYWSLREDLINATKARIPEWRGSDQNDFLTVLLEAVAFMGDILSYYTDRVANEAFLPTATQRQSLMNIAETYGYSPAGAVPAVASLQFTYLSDTAEETVTVPSDTQVRGTYNLAGEIREVIFETTAGLDVTTGTVADPDTGQYTGTGVILGVEGSTQKDAGTQANGDPIGILLGVSDGTPYQQFVISDDSVIQGSTRVWVHETLTNGREYYDIRSLADATRQSRVYRTRLYANGTTSIEFGDGASGAIPPAGTEIRVVYRRGGGIVGNVPVGVLDSLVDLDLDVSVTNISTGTGGAGAESNDSIRANAASALRARERVVTLRDAEDLAKTIPGVGDAKAVGSSLTNVGVYILPLSGEGDLSPGFISGVETSTFNTLKAEVKEFLANLVPFGTTVNTLSPSYIPLTISVTLYLPDGVRQSEAKDAVTSALKSLYTLGNYGFGATLFPADIYAIVSGLDTVRSCQLTDFQRSDTAGPATVSDPIYTAPSEVAYLDASTGLTLTLVGGINDLA